MAKLNPLDHPICLSDPLRLAAPTTWAGHIPFAMFIIDALRPKVLVELGTFTGVSYCAFCQAVKELNLDTRCYAIDTWKGDEHGGLYDGSTILEDLKRHHDPIYGNFSSLVQKTFDGSLNDFEDQAIDLLHIDGYHTHGSVRHDFESWLPKMTTRGIILFHDINVCEKDFGVRKFWEETKRHYPHFEFVHEHGLGVIAVGDVPLALVDLFYASKGDADSIRDFFYGMGRRFSLSLEKHHVIDTMSWHLKDGEQQIHSKQRQIQEQQLRIETLDRRSGSERQTIDALTAELTSRENRISAILNSQAWRWAMVGSRIKKRFFLPVYKPLSRLLGNGFAAAKNGEHSVPAARILAVPRMRTLDELARSITLLPATRAKELSSYKSRESTALPFRRLDVVCFSIIDWEFRYQRPQQIMSQFAARGHRVFYLRLHETLSANQRQRFSVRRLRENVFEVILAARRTPAINQEDVKGTNAAELLNSLDELRRACGIDDAIAYVMTPSWTSVALQVQKRWGWKLVYDCMDEWNDFPGMSSPVTRVEGQLVRQSDLVVTTAKGLFDKWAGFQRPLVLARNAVDYDFYVQRCRPNSLLSKERHPVIGYYGAIAEWFDLELLAHLARARPNYTFVLLGGWFVDVSELRQFPNVLLLGQQPYDTMPQYLYHFDVCLIPFKVNAITEATDPVKLYEYLSAGKPVVSTLLDEVKPLRELLYMAGNQEDFLSQVDKALGENDPELVARRRAFAATNTWHDRYETIFAGIREATPLASIVVVSYNNLPLTKLCLESILHNTDYPNYEVIVVDNSSFDGTPAYLRELARQYDHIKVILSSENSGFPRANNQGIARSTGTFLVLLNNDTIVPPGWLGRLLHHLEDPEVGMVGPMTNFAGNEAKIDVPYRTWGEMEDFASEHSWTHEGQVVDIKVLAMFCVALRRETYEKVGPLDEQFGIGLFEDDDYAQRIRAAGLRLICAGDVFVHHVGQAAFKRLLERGEYDELFAENRRRYETKWNVKWVAHKHGTLEFRQAFAEMKTQNQANEAWDSEQTPDSARALEKT